MLKVPDSAVPTALIAAMAAMAASVGAFPLAAGGGDCAVVATLPPGAYTVQLSGVNGATGVGANRKAGALALGVIHAF